MIEFHLDRRSGVPTYLQIVQQVKQAVRLGRLQPGDQLPRVKDVVTQLVINPNTVLKAYRELDIEGIVEGRRGQGTFISATLPSPSLENHEAVQKALMKWVESARRGDSTRRRSPPCSRRLCAPLFLRRLHELDRRSTDE